MIKCLKCNEINTDDSKFCSKCGNSLTKSDVNFILINDNQQSNPKENVQQNSKRNTKHMCLGLIGLLVILLIIGLFVGDTSKPINLEDVRVSSEFTIKFQNESRLDLYTEDGTYFYMIVINREDQRNPKIISDELQNQGFILQDSDNVLINNKNVKEEKYKYNSGDSFVYNYILEQGNKKYSISCLTNNNIWYIENEHNPVNKVINSMIKYST
ncbi:zinc-ribbon domain-containing protein [Methanosphaera sp. ISO3-F5]|uniref:zinc-ribbon domain-containing protein n=1 Tax=Methanosphaera sp. ISO3-F5 TaxID=1452353 RepID=UPI002B25EB82|nr:zinc-ribbon domain-containing protein [Methanosphaera sp. ISO3-F5]WQH63661.1 hypothetical protein PXD04_08130 [Methanosphaera sp. ISO3-F5]